VTPIFSFGPRVAPEGTTFRLWAPAAKRVELVLDRFQRMQAQAEGWHEIHVAGAPVGTLYKFRIDGELEVPDPASHYQPGDVAGPSEVIDHEAFQWKANTWRGRPWQEATFLELHIGAFTREGTFRAAIEKLDHVAATGFTAIELMPIADFAGRRNWGYDGVLLYAPDSAYGSPDDLRALIDAAHARGIMMFLDVVYNHFGPEGNYLSRYAPQFFAPADTPWGSAVNYRIPQVRAFAIENALHWLSRYRFDGLRLDAVHAISEPGEPSVLTELSRAVGEFAASSGRTIHVVLENDDNRATLLDPNTDPPRGEYRAQWNDDYHHAWHVLLTRERGGYYRDYASDPAHHLARVLASGFAYQGERSEHRGGIRRGEASRSLSPLAFVNFLQNHDQIGNRPLGDRLSAQVDEQALAAALAVTLLAPMPPLMFMGEEWGSRRPFPFFCDFTGALADAVREGRRQEFKDAYAEYGTQIPDPLNESTFRSAALDWEMSATPQGSRRLELVHELLTIRKNALGPLLADAAFGSARLDGPLLSAHWYLGDRKRLMLLANLSDAEPAVSAPIPHGRTIWGKEPEARITPWAVFWSLGED
jgi:maltooligosyltrehalose trehalohydrolase